MSDRVRPRRHLAVVRHYATHDAAAVIRGAHAAHTHDIIEARSLTDGREAGGVNLGA